MLKTQKAKHSRLYGIEFIFLIVWSNAIVYSRDV